MDLNKLKQLIELAQANGAVSPLVKVVGVGSNVVKATYVKGDVLLHPEAVCQPDLFLLELGE